MFWQKLREPKKQRRFNKILSIAILAIFAVSFLVLKFNQWRSRTTPPPPAVTAPISTLPVVSEVPFAERDPKLSAEQNLIKDYLANHLSESAPIKEVLGGKFFLTRIEFKSANEALLDYEDGHNAYRAKVNYLLDRQQLKVTGFTVLTENNSPLNK